MENKTKMNMQDLRTQFLLVYKMSWKEFINFIISRGNVDKAMVISSKDAALWASSHDDGSNKAIINC